MILKQKLEKAINKQINAELWSAYLYISMSAYFESINLSGFAHWMRVQAKEELKHAMKLYDHVIERLGRVTVTAIAAPQTTWKSPLHAFEETFKHEQKVTALIDDLVNLAIAEKDHATQVMLQWFVNEQVEEESSADQILQKLKLIDKNTGGLFMLNHELEQRKE
ncbi:MAG: ferritin [Methanobacteriota archaeon]